MGVAPTCSDYVLLPRCGVEIMKQPPRIRHSHPESQKRSEEAEPHCLTGIPTIQGDPSYYMKHVSVANFNLHALVQYSSAESFVAY